MAFLTCLGIAAYCHLGHSFYMTSHYSIGYPGFPYTVVEAFQEGEAARPLKTWAPQLTHLSFHHILLTKQITGPFQIQDMYRNKLFLIEGATKKKKTKNCGHI